MSLKESIVKDLQAIQNPQLLHQFYEYIQTIKKTKHTQTNREKVLQFAGLLSDKQANAIKKSIDENFNTIEGEW